MVYCFQGICGMCFGDGYQIIGVGFDRVFVEDIVQLDGGWISGCCGFNQWFDGFILDLFGWDVDNFLFWLV